MPTVQHKRGLRADFDVLVASDGLLVGQLYLIEDEDSLAVATSTADYFKLIKSIARGALEVAIAADYFYYRHTAGVTRYNRATGTTDFNVGGDWAARESLVYSWQ